MMLSLTYMYRAQVGRSPFHALPNTASFGRLTYLAISVRTMEVFPFLCRPLLSIPLSSGRINKYDGMAEARQA